MYFGLSQPQTSMFGLVIGSNKKIRLELGLHPAHSMNQPQLSMSKLNQQKVLIYRCFYFFQYNLMGFHVPTNRSMEHEG